MSIEAMKMALEALCLTNNEAVPDDIEERREAAIEALRQALAQLEQNESFLSCSIKDLNLHRRSINCLRAYQIKTVGELCDMYAHEINKIPNLGKVSFKNIVEALAEHGLSLKEKDK